MEAESPEDSLDEDPVPVAGGEAGGVPEGPLAPFGAIRWWIEDGLYRYDIPKQNTSGMATVEEMAAFPTTRFEDANKPPDIDNWYPVNVVYDESTGEAEIL